MSTMLLVQGDTKTQIQSTLTRANDGSVIDLNIASSVVMRFRRLHSTEILFTLTASQATPSDFENGKATFTFSGNNLDIDAGDYEGEIEITYLSDSTKETVFEVLRFIVREDFA